MTLERHVTPYSVFMDHFRSSIRWDRNFKYPTTFWFFEILSLRITKTKKETQDYLKFLSPPGKTWSKEKDFLDDFLEDYLEKEIKLYDLDRIFDNIICVSKDISGDNNDILLKSQKYLRSASKHLMDFEIL